MPLLSNGHAKTGLTSFYAGTLPRGRLEHVAATCSRYQVSCYDYDGHKILDDLRYELRAGQGGVSSEVDCVKSYDHLLAGPGGSGGTQAEEADTRGHTGDSTSGSGVHHSEVSITGLSLVRNIGT